MEWVASWNLFSFLALQLAIGSATTVLALGSWFLAKGACASSPKGWSRGTWSQQSQSTISRSSQLCHQWSCFWTQWPGDYEPSLKDRLKPLRNSPVLYQSVITRVSGFIFHIDTKTHLCTREEFPELESSFVEIQEKIKRVRSYKTDYSGHRDLYFYHYISICLCFIKGIKKGMNTLSMARNVWKWGLPTALREAQQ